MSSGWNQFTTARVTADPFSFVFPGDLTSDPEEKLWEQWFAAAGFITRIVPMIMVHRDRDHRRWRLAEVPGANA